MSIGQIIPQKRKRGGGKEREKKREGKKNQVCAPYDPKEAHCEVSS